MRLAVLVTALALSGGARCRVYELEDMERLVPRGFGVSWLPDGRSWSRRSGDSILRQDVSVSPLPPPTVILDEADLPASLRGYRSFTLSSDQRYVALSTNPTNIWGSSFKANYFLFDTASRTTQSLTTSDDQATQQMSPSFSNDGEMVAFVRSNNVFLRDVAPGAREVQVTADARRTDDSGVVEYGMSIDELYSPDPMDLEHSSRDLKNDFDSEVTETRFYSFQWSRDGRHVSFLRTDQSEVPIFNFIRYNNGLYPEVIDLPYSMPAEPNPKVEVAVYDMAADCLEFVDLEALLGYGPGELIISEVFWAESGELAIRATNRLQQRQWLVQVDVSGECVPSRRFTRLQARIAFERSDDKWIVSGYRGTGSLLRIPDSSLVVDITNGDGDKRHLFLTNTNATDNLPPRSITSGDWEAVSVVGYHAPTERIFYLSTENADGEASPIERHLWSIRVDGTAKTFLSTRGEPGSPPACGFFSASFSPTGEHYVLNFQGRNGILGADCAGINGFYEIPTSTLFSSVSTTYTPVVVEDNEAFAEGILELDMPTREIIQVPSADVPSGPPLWASVTLPVGYDAQQRYPVLVYIYGGPDSQTVSTRHMLMESLQDRMDLFLASHGYIIASVDCRGTGARGVDFMQEIYLNLGLTEAQDFIQFGRYLRERFQPTSLGIWGKSYGGYMTLKVLQKDTEGVFDAGVSLAPVTEWFWYNSGYTERFMQFPEMNSENYRESSVLGNVENYRNKDLLIIHGSGDDNVHYRHSVMLFDELIDAEIVYDTIVYPNDDHDLARRRHMNRYLERWLGDKMPTSA